MYASDDDKSSDSEDTSSDSEVASDQGLVCGTQGCPQKNTVWKTQERLQQHRLEHYNLTANWTIIHIVNYRVCQKKLTYRFWGTYSINGGEVFGLAPA